MGASYSTHIVVGFDTNDAIIIHKEIISQTKYNEDTGIPYTVETPKEKRYFGNIDITETCLEDCIPRLMPGMKIYQADHEDNSGSAIIGKAITTLNVPCVIKLMKTTDIESIRQQVKTQAMSNIGLDIDPGLFVVFCCSY